MNWKIFCLSIGLLPVLVSQGNPVLAGTDSVFRSASGDTVFPEQAVGCVGDVVQYQTHYRGKAYQGTLQINRPSGKDCEGGRGRLVQGHFIEQSQDGTQRCQGQLTLYLTLNPRGGSYAQWNSIQAAPGYQCSGVGSTPKLSLTYQNHANYLIQADRVGQISRTTNRQELIQLFGASHLQDFTLHGAEGEGNYPATRITIANQRVLEVQWENENRQQVKSVTVYDSCWHTANRITVNTSVSELQKQFGQFQFYGFGWDYGGQILQGNAKLDQYRQQLHLNLQLGLPTGSCHKMSSECKAVMGEQKLSSNNETVERLNAKVVSLSVSF